MDCVVQIRQRVGWRQILSNRKRVIGLYYASIIEYFEKNVGCPYGCSI